MPWKVVSGSAKCPAGKPYAVVQKSDGSLAGCHVTRESANKQLAALYANEKRPREAQMSTEETRRTFTADERKNAAKSGAAMPDGSFPIHTKEDLKNAIHLAGNAKNPAAARAHIKKRARALGASDMIPASWEQQQESSSEPPRDEVFRAIANGVTLVEPETTKDGRLGTLHGHFTRFNEWAKIDSAFEGKFMERVAPGAFTKAFSESRGGMRVLFQHGQDPQVGNKPLGPIEELREDEEGPYYQVALLDTSYNRDLIPGLEAGLYGASFRFRVLQQRMDKNPEAHEANPDRLPERTIREVSVKEFGPVTFPAYAGATAGIRSLTDEFIFAKMVSDPDRLRQLISYIPDEPEDESSDETTYTADQVALREAEPPHGHSGSGSRVSRTGKPYLYGDQKRSPSWVMHRSD